MKAPEPGLARLTQGSSCRDSFLFWGEVLKTHTWRAGKWGWEATILSVGYGHPGQVACKEANALSLLSYLLLHLQKTLEANLLTNYLAKARRGTRVKWSLHQPGAALVSYSRGPKLIPAGPPRVYNQQGDATGL